MRLRVIEIHLLYGGTFTLLKSAFIRGIFSTKSSFRYQHNWGIKKQHRKVKLHFNLNIMADSKIEEVLAPLRAAVKEKVYMKNIGYSIMLRLS